MDKKQTIELALTGMLVLILAVVLVFTLKPKPKKKKKNAGQAAAAELALPSDIPQPEAPKVRAPADEQALAAQQKRTNLEWGRDPFFASFSAVSFREGNIELKGIIYSRKNPAALINENVVFEGDTMGGIEIFKIDRNSVVLHEGKRKFILRLEERKEDEGEKE